MLKLCRRVCLAFPLEMETLGGEGLASRPARIVIPWNTNNSTLPGLVQINRAFPFVSLENWDSTVSRRGDLGSSLPPSPPQARSDPSWRPAHGLPPLRRARFPLVQRTASPSKRRRRKLALPDEEPNQIESGFVFTNASTRPQDIPLRLRH